MAMEDLFFGGTEILKFVVSVFIILVASLFAIIKTHSKIIGGFAAIIAGIICYLFELLNVYTLLILVALFGLPLLAYLILGGRN